MQYKKVQKSSWNEPYSSSSFTKQSKRQLLLLLLLLLLLRPTGHTEDPRDLAELDVGQSVPAELERAAVADQDEPGLAVPAAAAAGRRQAEPGAVGGAAKLPQQPAEPVVLGLAAQAAAFAERLRQDEMPGAQVVEHEAEPTGPPWKSQSERQRTEINGESTSMVWPTLGSRTAKEHDRTDNIT